MNNFESSTQQSAEANSSEERLRDLKRAIRSVLQIGFLTVASWQANVARTEVAEGRFDALSRTTVERIDRTEHEFKELQARYGLVDNNLYAQEVDSVAWEKKAFANSWPLSELKKRDVPTKESDSNTNKGEEEGLPISTDSLSGIESTGGLLDKNDLEEILERKFPRNWLGNISSIKQKDESKTQDIAHDEYGLGKGWVTLAFASLTSSGKTEITMLKPTKERSLDSNLGTLYHEIAHANDWERSTHLTTEEKIDLLFKVTARIESADRYKSAYVESIKSKNLGDERYLKVTEYWAEINRVYSENQSALNIADFRVVDTFRKLRSNSHVANN